MKSTDPLTASLFIIIFKKCEARNGAIVFVLQSRLCVRIFSPPDGHGGHSAVLEIPLHHHPRCLIASLPPFSGLKPLSGNTECGCLRGPPTASSGVSLPFSLSLFLSFPLFLLRRWHVPFFKPEPSRFPAGPVRHALNLPIQDSSENYAIIHWTKLIVISNKFFNMDNLHFVYFKESRKKRFDVLNSNFDQIWAP